MTNNDRGTYTTVDVAQGRSISCSKAAKGVGEFTFKELCDEAVGSTDYAAIGRNFNTIILRKVPQLSMDRRDWVRRFILLIDALYYQHRNLVIECEVDLDHLFDIS